MKPQKKKELLIHFRMQKWIIFSDKTQETAMLNKYLLS